MSSPDKWQNDPMAKKLAEMGDTIDYLTSQLLQGKETRDTIDALKDRLSQLESVPRNNDYMENRLFKASPLVRAIILKSDRVELVMCPSCHRAVRPSELPDTQPEEVIE